MLANITQKDIVLTDVKEFKSKIGHMIYVYVSDGGITASTRKSEINSFIESDEMLTEMISGLEVGGLASMDILIVHGIVMDVKNLPVEMPEKLKDMKIFLFYKINPRYGVVDYDSFKTIEDVTDEIESILEEHPLLLIDDFAIIVGDNVTATIQIKEGVKSITMDEIFGKDN